MSEIKGIDIAWQRPTIADIKATGATWVARYFSNDPTKDLTAGEVQSYPANGLGIVTVFESTATEALMGFHAGAADAQHAINERKAVGLPSDMPIHFGVDTNTDGPHVQAYFDGVCSVLDKGLVGVYGGFRIAEWAHSYGLKYIWQTVAWSNGQWSQWATIRQVLGTVLHAAADVDFAEVPDFGQYPRPETNMPITDADAQKIADAIWNRVISNDAGALTAATHLGRANVYSKLALDAVGKISTGGVDPAALTKEIVQEIGHDLSNG